MNGAPQQTKSPSAVLTWKTQDVTQDYARITDKSAGHGYLRTARIGNTAKFKEESIRIVGDCFQLGVEIGRGGFGIVYAALDLRNGRSVAIKEVSLQDIDTQELSSIESEINLLKKLNHENIVKYHDTIKTQTSLFIILEYMENGCLAQFIKKFGCLSETLVAMYIAQVLRGLAYLHEQGVLHRDVKGANILTTKDGLVKIADFGVAVKLNEAQKTNSVVGSPYWMAPEVIEMAGWSFASDIWSVGCTITELLTTKPPYFDLPPMAALFRIVQDDHPPLPERISPALQDFIGKCFMKEPRLRASAVELLSHPWIAQIPKNKVEQSSQMVAEHITSLMDRDSMLNTIKLYEKEKHMHAISGKKDEIEEDWDEEFEEGGTISGKVDTIEAEKDKGAFYLSVEDADALFSDEVWEDGKGGMTHSRVILPDKSMLRMERQRTKLDSFCEDDEEKIFADIDEQQLMQAIQTKRSYLTPLDCGEDFPPFQDTFLDYELDFEYVTARDSHQQVIARVAELLTLLDPVKEDELILSACDDLRDILSSHPLLTSDLMMHAGMIPNIMEALEFKQFQVLFAVLQVLNMIVERNCKLQENLALMGFIPIIIKLTQCEQIECTKQMQDVEVEFTSLIRVEAAKFIGQICKTSVLTLQMFIACGGLPVLADFLHAHDANVENDSIFQRIAMDGITSIFSLQTIPKNDICRLFVKADLLCRFISVFNSIVQQVQEQFQNRTTEKCLCWRARDVLQMCEIFLYFSQGDIVVKEHMCERTVLNGILCALMWSQNADEENLSLILRVEAEACTGVILTLLKCVRNLSMEPATLEALDEAGVIQVLVHLLERNGLGKKQKEGENLVLQTMFYLCRLNKARQTHAAQAGLIRSLRKVIKENSPLKQFAIPILCDLVLASSIARTLLWENEGVLLFLELLEDRYWQTDAIKSLSAWLLQDTMRMETLLLLPPHFMKIIQGFLHVEDTDVENVLEPILEMMSRSVHLNQAFGRCGLFVNKVIQRLRADSKAIVRKNLIQMIKIIFESHAFPTQFVIEFELYPIVHTLAQDANDLILVKEIALQLLQAILINSIAF